MYKKIFILLFGLFVSIQVFSQVELNDLYEFYPEPLKTFFLNKEEIRMRTLGMINYYKDKKTIKGKINISCIAADKDSKAYFSIPDSIYGRFEVLQITRFDSSFHRIKWDMIEPIDVYQITIARVEDSILVGDSVNIRGKYYQRLDMYNVLSVDYPLDYCNKIKVGQRYDLLLISFFDKCDNIFHDDRQDFCIDNVCIFNFPIGMIGCFYTTPNMIGLNYHENK